MPVPYLEILSRPRLSDGTMLLALTGWMDGGLVSTGTVRRIMEGRRLAEIARIDPDPFYIYNFPGSMDVASIFRPKVKHDDGLIAEMEMPADAFYADVPANLAFFVGKEPNLRWQAFANCIFAVAADLNVKRMIFMGSFGGTVPHTREPRMYGSVSHPHLEETAEDQRRAPQRLRRPGRPVDISTQPEPRAKSGDAQPCRGDPRLPGGHQSAQY